MFPSKERLLGQDVLDWRWQDGLCWRWQNGLDWRWPADLIPWPDAEAHLFIILAVYSVGM